LSENERRFLKSNIERGGGQYIFENVQKKLDWLKWARKKRVCIKCAAKGHQGKDCTIEPCERGKNSEDANAKAAKLHAMLQAMDLGQDSAIQDDQACLCSLQDRTHKPLMLYECAVNGHKGIALGDTGGSHTYVSKQYAEKANLKFLEKRQRVVKLPNEHEMVVYGACTFHMKMSK